MHGEWWLSVGTAAGTLDKGVEGAACPPERRRRSAVALPSGMTSFPSGDVIWDGRTP